MAVIALAITACEKEPDMDKLSYDYLVYTNYDKSANFSSFTSYYIPDSVLVVDGKDQQTVDTTASADAIIAALKSEMSSRGYTLAADKESANLGMQVSYVQNTYYFTEYGYPNWGWNDTGYWGNYWGNYWGGGYYYPFTMNYALSTNAYIIDLVNLQAIKGTSAKLPVLWSCYLVGPTYSEAATTKQVLIGVTQAFGQSPYLKK